ncbi:MAG: inorganic phosphate transporter [Phycisphaerales bacterium]|nr:MAG: inorganic phosphate transporter [Phycisphaerales bacterium]
MSIFLWVAGGLALIMLIWDTVEVGRNDAANLVNAVFGARLMSRRRAVWLAGLAVVVGAALSSKVIETARKGIFEPSALESMAHPEQAAIGIYLSVYVVDTVLLYGYSAFGMPVSTTATLVFTLLGAASVVGGGGIVNWAVSSKVIAAIILSIVLTGLSSFVLQRAVRGAIRERAGHWATMLAHGGWVGGGMAAGLCYFLLLKGMRQIPLIGSLREYLFGTFDAVVVIFALWGGFTIVIHILLVVFGKKAARLLFPTMAVLGMLAMAFAFGQNDLANCASAGLAILNLIWHRDQGVVGATEIAIPRTALLVCGVFLMVGMTTRYAQRVTHAAASTGSQGDHVELWAPAWCLALARFLLRGRPRAQSFAPRVPLTTAGEVVHYDSLRASVIMAVSASVIATASDLGMPVSTTYVAFAAVVATGMADRIFQRGDSVLKLGRAIWVVFSWFMGAAIAVVAGGLVAGGIYRLGVFGIGIALAVNLTARRILKVRSDAQERRVREEARERMAPERYAEELEGG